MNEELSRLEEVELREVWDTEDQHFTPWLAQNLDLLAETLNMDFDLDDMEVNVGTYRADILCKNTTDGSWVVIENQLEQTNHGHLGQILTYSAGLNSHIVIWIAKKFRDEHRAVLNQLNEITDDRFSYFGIEIKLWRIGKSLPAVQFDIVCSPNNWSRAAQQTANENVSQIGRLRQRFWTKFSEHLRNNNSSFTIQTPPTQATAFYSIGRNGFRLHTTLSVQRNQISVQLGMFNPTGTSANASAYFQLLMEQQDEIDSDFNGQLEWNPKINRIALFRNDIDLSDEVDWHNQHVWLASNLEQFRTVFQQRVMELNVAEEEQLEDKDDE